MTLIFAHRGSKGTHPENTMLSFKEAERVGADGIELDIQLTKDGEVIIIHDDKVDRTTNGRGYIGDLSLKEIKKLNAAHHYQNGQHHETIPTLSEFLQWFKNTKLICNIEYKTNSISNFELIEKAVGLVKQFGVDERIIFSSFNHYAIVHSYRLAPHIEIAPLFTEGIYMPWIYAESIAAKGIHPNYKAAPKEIIEKSQNHGIAVRPYTVNKDKDLLYFFEAKTEAIITDFPEKAIELYNEFKVN